MFVVNQFYTAALKGRQFIFVGISETGAKIISSGVRILVLSHVFVMTARCLCCFSSRAAGPWLVVALTVMSERV